MQGLWTKTAASGFRMTAGTPSGRYGLPLWNRDRSAPLTPRRLRVPLSGPGWHGAVIPAGYRRILPREWKSQAAAK